MSDDPQNRATITLQPGRQKRAEGSSIASITPSGAVAVATKPVATVSVSPASATRNVGQTIQLAVTLTDAFAALDATWPELHEGWARFASVPIRNIATLAAFQAAGDGGRIEARHILAAVRTEYAKTGKPLTAAELRGLNDRSTEREPERGREPAGIVPNRYPAGDLA